MQMRPAIQIQSMMKSLTDVVLPALDPTNKLAQEQGRLILGMLNLMSKQLPLQYRFDCDELARLTAFASDLQSVAVGGEQTRSALAELEGVHAQARDLLDRARVAPDSIEQAVRSLRAATGAVVTGVYRDGESNAQHRVEGAVLAMSREQLLRDRAFVAAQGWEPDPAALPPIEDLLRTP